MFNKFKAVLYNVVGNVDYSEGATTSALGSGVRGQASIIPSFNRQNGYPKERVLRFPYTRPYFLQLSCEEEILVTADQAIRPIICPRDITRLPWNTGYAETINAGKSKRNEDQAAIHCGYLTKTIPKWTENCTQNAGQSDTSQISNDNVNAGDGTGNLEQTLPKPTSIILRPEGATISENVRQQDLNGFHPKQLSVENSLSLNVKSHIDAKGQLVISLPYFYFGVFDGHAGWGAAVSASNELQHIIHDKLSDIIDLILPEIVTPNQREKASGPLWYMERTVTPESAVIGALEQAFWQMDRQIAEDRLKYQLTGGCTACIGLFILGKLFVSNAGDSRGILSKSEVPYPMSFDFTPETEIHRIKKLGALQPELLGGEFTHLEFLRRPMKRDVGKKAVYRDHYMTGWGYKTITMDDLKYPLVCGEGKRSRVLATIGVTRGFGDHDLRAQSTSLPIKPFLSPEPEVRVFDLSDVTLLDSDTLILGTDGLWDITSNEKAVTSVCNSLKHFPSTDMHRHKYRYTSAAQDLVMCSRGKMKDYSWRTADDKHATIDDISVFVVPLKPYQEIYKEWLAHYESLILSNSSVECAREATSANTLVQKNIDNRQIDICVSDDNSGNSTEMIEKKPEQTVHNSLSEPVDQETTARPCNEDLSHKLDLCSTNAQAIKEKEMEQHSVADSPQDCDTSSDSMVTS